VAAKQAFELSPASRHFHDEGVCKTRCAAEFSQSGAAMHGRTPNTTVHRLNSAAQRKRNHGVRKQVQDGVLLPWHKGCRATERDK
jgi:hypothetical protein